MKKVISLLLALVMCLSLCACGKEKTQDAESHNVPEAQETTMETYTEEAVVNTEPTQPQIIEVELTTENWQEYFDTENIISNYGWRRNSFDEIEEFHGCEFAVPLKEEYKNRITNLGDIEIAHEISGTQGYREIMIDIENEQVSIGEEWEDDYMPSEPHTADYTTNGYVLVESGLRFGQYYNNVRMGGGEIAHLFEVSELVRIKGTLYLFAE